MPPASSPKPTSKKTGAPKAKGAVRAKSGCYTCRIRRKKCDERPDAEGRCETCLRLRLQCLGFGAKRPEWLRENNNVSELRDKIKSFLASQGMIKGHSGSGPRAPEQEPPTLHLSTQDYNAQSESPPSQLLVLSDEVVRHGPVSNVRGEQQWPYTPSGGPNYEAPVLPQVGQSSRTASPFGPPQDGAPYDPYMPATLPHNSTSLVQTQSQWTSYPNMMPQRPNLLPTMGSRFGNSYTALIPDEDSLYFTVDSAPPLRPNLFASEALDELANHYMTTVAALQYQLADKLSLPDLIFDEVQNGNFARYAARLLASVHCQRSQTPMFPALTGTPTKDRYEELLRMFSFARKDYNDDDALAALNVISTFLFDGGHGDWERWLHVACTYSASILDDRSRFHDYRDAMMSCTEKERFIIKTTFWFDVLASVTTMAPPYLTKVINELYNPANQSGIYDVADESETAAKLSMLPVMGCENRIVWGMTQISKLHAWKQTANKEGRLSIMELGRKANEIEAFLSPPSPPLSAKSDDDVPRIIASEIFRTSAIVYLRTIVSGDHPLVPEISDSVADAVVSLEAVKTASSQVRTVVVRSTVFAVFICAALTTRPYDREFLLDLLKQEGKVGNCMGVLDVLNQMQLGQSKPKTVPWREILRDSKMLLV